MHKQAECSTTLVIAFISPHLSTKKNMETNYHIWMTRLWIWQDNSNRIQQTGKEVRNTFLQGHREPRSAAIWSGEIPPLSALFASAPWLRRRLTTAVDPVPCTAKTRERDPLQLGHWQVGLHVWGPRVRDTTAGHSTAADLVPVHRSRRLPAMNGTRWPTQTGVLLYWWHARRNQTEQLTVKGVPRTNEHVRGPGF